MTFRPFLTTLAFVAMLPAQALAWGSTGHAMINRLGAQTLPASVPAFLRSRSAVDEISTLGPEEDRIKGAGDSWDGDNDAAHFLDLADDGTVAGAVRLDQLPKNMAGYADALAKAGTTPYKQGFVPYAIMDGFERVRKDLAYWRVDDYLSSHAGTPEARAHYAAERGLRETLTMRDIGDWGHFVADGSQPLHISIHFNGWGNYPNPNNFTEKHIHAFFESDFVDRYARANDVEHLMQPYKATAPQTVLSQEAIGKMVGAYLEETAAQVEPLYRLYGSGAFDAGKSDAVSFTDRQLARGASQFRDLIALAWEDSVNETVGYPPLAVRDILAGKVTPSEAPN